jgi:hypothetical protein
MSDRTELSTEVEDTTVNYLAELAEDDNSLDGLEEFFVPPMLKKLEATSKPKELVDEFGAGSIVLTGQNSCVWKKDDPPFKFVPILFVPIIRKWKDLKDTEPPKIVDQTFNMRSDMAKTARSAERRGAEEYGNGFKYQYVEHLTFLGVIYDGLHAGTQCVLSFERSGHFKGKSFITAIQSRKITGKDNVMIRQPLWSQVWGISLIEQHNQFGDWHGFNFHNMEQSVIGQQHMKPFREMNATYKAMQEKNLIVLDEESTSTAVIDDDDGGM